MPLLRPSLPLWAAQSGGSSTRAAARAALDSRTPPFPVIPTCPGPTCACSPMPAGLDIDRTHNLNGSMSPYAQHLIISTGRADWTSRIEDEKDTAVWGRFIAETKSLLGRGGEFHDPFNNILISTSSFKPWQVAEREHQAGKASVQAQSEVDALLFPAFDHVRGLNLDADPDLPRKFVRSSLLPDPAHLHPIYKDLSEAERRAKTRDPDAGSSSLVRKSIEAPTILICSHGQRDSRCGILGPLLHAEFARYMEQRQDQDDTGSDSSLSSVVSPESNINVNIGMVSHIGGHKWAGNVIFYIPPTFTSQHHQHRRHPLAGMGIWYGRVEPRHVQGIVEQTLMQGKVIQDLFRGGVSRSGEVLRL
ncbi:hypothetical protein A1O1_01948 [Capronia coronata CBS 617.96]|uniref:Altered inheritance of mitochondria protein 32 n=1 Tax=Capronia coronata CBS 617.96 TaxID=1182541 RepID=W9YWA7_9EURO|nr:uncharacterized protein A1O1_01948 [Capronia coronata CBS 617.96]EXJ93556.1 hypothetical protein A1O1_01948 [Capronia coronata CBS 617.96]